MYKRVFFVLFAVSMALQSGVPALLAQIKEIPAHNDKGAEFKALLELELSQGSGVQQVVDMIGDLLEQLKADQQVEDLEHTSKMTTLNLDIKELEINLESLSKERQVTNQFIYDATQELTALSQTINSIKVQLDTLNGREEDIRTARGTEQANYNHRTQSNNKVLDALQQVLKRLTEAVFQEKDRQGTALIQTERDTIVEQIRREIGYNSPIAVLVAMTSKFDVGTVTRIIEKIETIRDGIIESQTEEDAREVNAASVFQSVVSEITDVRTKLAQDFSNGVATQKKRSNEKVIKERTLGVLNSDIETTQSLLLNTKTQRDQFDATYQARRDRRTGEIKTIKQAYDLVNTHAQRIKAQGGF